MSYRSYGAIGRLSPPLLFLPLKSAALDFGLDMKRLDRFKLLSAQSGSALPDVFNKEPRTVASAAGGLGCCSRLRSILSNVQEKKKRELFTSLSSLSSDCLVHHVSEHEYYILCKHVSGSWDTGLNRWTKATENLCSALSGLSLSSASARRACVYIRLCARQDFQPETMQQKPHLMWEESDGLPRGECVWHIIFYLFIILFSSPFNSKVWKWRWDGLWVSGVVTGLLILAVSQEHNHRKTLGTNEGFGSLSLKRKREGREGDIFLLAYLFVWIISLCGWRCVEESQGMGWRSLLNQGMQLWKMAGHHLSSQIGHGCVLSPGTCPLPHHPAWCWLALATYLHPPPEVSVPSCPIKGHLWVTCGFWP